MRKDAMSKPKERRLYDPTSAIDAPRREWVTLDRGDVCVHEMTLAETMQITERAARPACDPRGGHNRAQTVVLQIMFSCRLGEEPDAKRAFTDADLGLIHDLRFHEFDALLAAINRVSGKSATEEERLRDFSTAMEPIS